MLLLQTLHSLSSVFLPTVKRFYLQKNGGYVTKLDELFEKKYGAIRGGQSKLSRDLGADQSTISGWIKGRTTALLDDGRF